VIRLGAATVNALKNLREHQAQEIEAINGLWRDPRLVFATKKGTPLDASNVVNRSFKPLLERAGLRTVKFHSLRHTCGTLLLSEGVDIKTIQEILGHSSITVTMDVYAHVLPDMQAEAAAAMDRIFSNP
jgi:integrase